jgi:hypothetical protein
MLVIALIATMVGGLNGFLQDPVQEPPGVILSIQLKMQPTLVKARQGFITV